MKGRIFSPKSGCWQQWKAAFALRWTDEEKARLIRLSLFNYLSGQFSPSQTRLRRIWVCTRWSWVTRRRYHPATISPLKVKTQMCKICTYKQHGRLYSTLENFSQKGKRKKNRFSVGFVWVTAAQTCSVLFEGLMRFPLKLPLLQGHLFPWFQSAFLFCPLLFWQPNSLTKS